MAAYLSVCAIYRDEARYLREWVAFHQLVGAERFYLYNNLSEDDHREALAPFVEDGTVVMHEWPMFPGQLQAYGHCLDHYRDESRWIAFLDLDEFLFSPTGSKVSELLPPYEDANGVGVNCLAFGTSGHLTPPPGLVIENYVRRTDFEPRNCIIKSIVNPRRVREHGNDPHYFKYLDGFAVDENGQKIRGPRTEALSCSKLRINHYITRSQEERNRKLAGREAFSGKPKAGARGHERDKMLNDVVDEAIQMYVPELRAALEALAQRQAV
jgi:hypothetical protein